MRREYSAHLTMKSANAKTGPIPVSVTESDTCPLTCPFYGDGCYAETGPLGLHWGKVSRGERGMPWSMFCDAVATMPDGQLWRHNAAGDLPGDGTLIDREALDMLLDANAGKRGFTYTHYLPHHPGNALAIVNANLCGLTVNLSANSIEEADDLADLGLAPVVCIMPMDATSNTKTPKGRTVVVCPATQRDDVTCESCQLCQRPRTTIVGFPAHGIHKKRISIRLEGSRV